MKILFASHLYPNPVTPLLGVFVEELARAISPLRPVSVVAPVTWLPGTGTTKGVPRRRLDGLIEVFHPHRIACPGPFRNFRWRAHVAALRRCELSGPWSVIHSHWVDPDALAVSHWAGRHGALLVATIHGHAALGLGLHGRPSPHVRTALHRMDHLVVVSNELKLILVEQFGLAPDRISILFNGVDSARFRPSDRLAARLKLGLRPERRVVLNVARLSPEKRHDLLFTALARCPDRDFDLHLVGGGPLDQQLKFLVQRAGLSERVVFQGGIPHSQLPDWYAAADLFCLASDHEGCPVVVHEALACGLPVVSTRVGSVPDLVGLDSGILCHPGDPAALASALAHGLATSWDHAAIARHGAAHTWAGVARQLVALYERLGPVRGEPSGLVHDRASRRPNAVSA